MYYNYYHVKEWEAEGNLTPPEGGYAPYGSETKLPQIKVICTNTFLGLGIS